MGLLDGGLDLSLFRSRERAIGIVDTEPKLHVLPLPSYRPGSPFGIAEVIELHLTGQDPAGPRVQHLDGKHRDRADGRENQARVEGSWPRGVALGGWRHCVGHTCILRTTTAKYKPGCRRTPVSRCPSRSLPS